MLDLLKTSVSSQSKDGTRLRFLYFEQEVTLRDKRNVIHLRGKMACEKRFYQSEHSKEMVYT